MRFFEDKPQKTSNFEVRMRSKILRFWAALHHANELKYSNLWPLLATKAKTDKPIFKGLLLLNSFVFVY